MTFFCSSDCFVYDIQPQLQQSCYNLHPVEKDEHCSEMWQLSWCTDVKTFTRLANLHIVYTKPLKGGHWGLATTFVVGLFSLGGLSFNVSESHFHLHHNKPIDHNFIFIISSILLVEGNIDHVILMVINNV